MSSRIQPAAQPAPQAAQAASPQQEAPSLEQVRNGDGSFKPGHHGEPVYKLSSILASLGFLLASPPSRSYGPAMQIAARAFQEAHDIEPTGEIDGPTLRKIETEAASKEIQQSSAEPPAEPPAPVNPPEGNAQAEYRFVPEQLPPR